MHASSPSSSPSLLPFYLFCRNLLKVAREAEVNMSSVVLTKPLTRPKVPTLETLFRFLFRFLLPYLNQCKPSRPLVPATIWSLLNRRPLKFGPIDHGRKLSTSKTHQAAHKKLRLPQSGQSASLLFSSFGPQIAPLKLGYKLLTPATITAHLATLNLSLSLSLNLSLVWLLNVGDNNNKHYTATSFERGTRRAQLSQA